MYCSLRVDVARGGEEGHSPHICSISCRFVLGEAVSQTKHRYLFNVNYLPPPQFWAGYATEPTLFQISNSHIFCDNFAKLQNEESPQLANLKFQCRNAG